MSNNRKDTLQTQNSNKDESATRQSEQSICLFIIIIIQFWRRRLVINEVKNNECNMQNIYSLNNDELMTTNNDDAIDNETAMTLPLIARSTHLESVYIVFLSFHEHIKLADCIWTAATGSIVHQSQNKTKRQMSRQTRAQHFSEIWQVTFLSKRM